MSNFSSQNAQLCKSTDLHAKCSAEGFNCIQGCKVLLQCVPANIKARMWFQHDGAPAHFSADMQSALDSAYPERWIGRGGLVNWPARSPA
ncbi:hypothetical protein TNCV_1714631 [Trichonephila clavipes]|nr:hypothetical protein TNCV_1714631 [Trichonephila clavipes]